jgi:protein-L-isoaspartate(D-aspartate) O-methyltransferase
MSDRMRRLSLLVFTTAFLLTAAFSQSDGAPYQELRNRMVREIVRDARMTASYTGRDRLSETVLNTLKKVPRHRFVPENLRDRAYQNRPLPIGFGQTISQPYIVALMTDLLEIEDDHRILEIGTGSAYQAAVLGELAAKVYTIEIIPELAEMAKERLTALGYTNIVAFQGDGYYGLEKEAPFDGIIVTAAASHIPPPLVAQLKPGGVMVIPVGGPFLTQELIRVRKQSDGTITSEQLLPVAFVPLTGGR